MSNMQNDPLLFLTTENVYSLTINSQSHIESISGTESNRAIQMKTKGLLRTSI